MRKFLFLARTLCAALSLLAASAWAHHSFGAEYDASKPVTLTGVVTKVEWTNPHSHIYMDVKDPRGKVANWKFEGYPPSVLARNGWKRDVTLKSGDQITIFGWRARDGTNWAHGREVTLAAGRRGSGDPRREPARAATGPPSM